MTRKCLLQTGHGHSESATGRSAASITCHSPSTALTDRFTFDTSHLTVPGQLEPLPKKVMADAEAYQRILEFEAKSSSGP